MAKDTIRKVAEEANNEIGGILSIAPLTTEPLEEITAYLEGVIRDVVKRERERIKLLVAKYHKMEIGVDTLFRCIRQGGE